MSSHRSRQGRAQRALLRRPRAAHEARARKAADPFEQARQRCKAASLPHSCTLVVDAIAERHHELGKKLKGNRVYIGYGEEKEPERRRHQDPPRLPTLAEATGLDRRTCMRAIALLVALEILDRKYGGGERTVWVPCHREKYLEGDQVKYRAAGELRPHVMGKGGCDPGGSGNANGYLVPGMPEPEPDPTPRPPATPEPPPARERPQGWQRVKAIADQLAPGRPRGP